MSNKGLNGGEAVQLTDYFAMRPALSSDGQRIAFFYLSDEQWLIGIISSEGGKIEQSVSVPDGVHDRIIRWSADGKSLFYVSNEGEVGNILQLPLDGGQPQKITDFDSQIIQEFAISGDGNKLMITRMNVTNDIVNFTWQH